jgi:tetratricopeptide (TPR) repeat protein
MELILAKTTGTEIRVMCAGQFSHTFDLPDMPPDPVETGARLFAALFTDRSPARAAWDARPKRILLVAEDPELDAIPWEYLYGPDGFVILDVAFVRGLPVARRQPVPDLAGVPLHIVVLPSNPISHDIVRLDIEGEWTRLKEALHGLETAVRMERVRPPTLEQARRLTANQRCRVVHFMGHGGHSGAEACLVFEKEDGAPDFVSARDLVRRLEDAAFLVTLNACASAAPGETAFANIAWSLAGRGVPYTLGMRSPIPDDDAKAFSETFYGELARGSSVENALRQARNTLAGSENPRAVGIPVLYTSLEGPPSGFVTPAGTPRIDEHQLPLELSALPRAEGTFQGRVDELLQLGAFLTEGEKVVTIHGPGGQGKTALAREAAERFAHAWPGGVWAISLEHASALERFTLELARLLRIDLDGIYKQIAAAHPNQETDVFQGYVQQELERRICRILNRERALLVLDNAETFTEAINAKDKSALDLAAFLKEKVLSTQAGLLVTSREHLGWTGEKAIELPGLFPGEGARLFWHSAPGRGKEAIGPLAQEISRKVEGHPLSLRLLGGAFDASGISLDEFVQQVEETLLQAEDKYKYEDHRHKTLFASIETSVRYLDEPTKVLLSGLWIFQSSFQPDTVMNIFADTNLSKIEMNTQQAQIAEQLQTLWQHGLLLQDIGTLVDGNLLLYRILPIVRLFARSFLVQIQPVETLQKQMAKVYMRVLQNIDKQLDRSNWASYLAGRCREDLEICAKWLDVHQKGWYANRLGWVLHRLGDRQAGQRWLEQALEIAQGMDQMLELDILNNIALVSSATGQQGQALALLEQILPIRRQVGDRAGEATTLNNMALIYNGMGQLGKALALFEQALPIRHEVDNRAGEATTLNNMAGVYNDMGQPGQALALLEQALPIRREVGHRAGEAITLNNMGRIYRDTGQPGQALELLEQALSLMREVGDRAGEATTLNNIAGVYKNTGQSSQALVLLGQVLVLMREVGDRAGEATALNDMALIYNDITQPGQALELLEQALVLMRKVGDRAGEATILTNIGLVYSDTGQLVQAQSVLEQALPLTREVGYRAGEATALNNIARIYRDTGQPKQAQAFLEQALPLMREVGYPAGEAVTCFNMAMLAHDIGQPQRAIELLRLAVQLQKQVQHSDYVQNAATLARWEAEFQQTSVPFSDLPKVNDFFFKLLNFFRKG